MLPGHDAADHSPSAGAGTPPAADANPRVAYIVSRFPKLTETFVLFEMQAIEAAGARIELFPLQRERAAKVHPEALAWVERAHFQPFMSWPILRANIEVFAGQPARYVSTLLTLLRCTLGSLRFFVGGLVFFPKAVRMARLMKDGVVGHIHAHFASHPAAAAWVAHRLSGIPYSFTAHGSDLHVDRHMLEQKVAEAAFVVTISEFNGAVIRKTCGARPGGPVQVVHCGVNLADFPPRDAQRRQGGRFMIACVGTLHEVKGQSHLVDACARLARQGIDFECHLVGDGPDRAMLERRAAGAGVADRIVFRGAVTHAAVREILRTADVVVAPSVPTKDGRREGIPVAIMEAMAGGAAVVASRLSGIPELVIDGETGLLAEPGDAPGIAAALERLVRDPGLRRRLAEGGRGKVEREFDLHKNAALLLAHIRHASLRAVTMDAAR